MVPVNQTGGRHAVAVVRVQGRGQLTLPASFRKAVGVRPGDVLLLEERGPGHFEVRVLSRRSLLDFPRIDLDHFDMSSAREQMESELAAEGVDEPAAHQANGNKETAARDEVTAGRDA